MKFTVLRPVQLPSGTLLKIGDDLAKRHAANLQHVKGKQFMCLGPMWLKAGQVIDLDEPPKHVLDSLQAEAVRSRKAEPVAATATNEEGSDAAPTDSDPAGE